MTQEHKDEELWKIAKKRVQFKESVIWYIAVNTFLRIVWYFTISDKGQFWSWWPIFPMFWRGVALIVQYFKIYSDPYGSAVDKEFRKLKNEK